ncbi:MAG TPA: BatA domain-containing protein [Candidatus Saccharimonadia bacterium]|nr:BatA domain-containing protein [Candidatus Saccharimonadia bacterium]
MWFLNTILLAGAAAFLIPLIIHLLNKRRVTTVAWGAMHLLHEALRQKKRNVKVEQLLLLIARISIPILLALCLARPVFT